MLSPEITLISTSFSLNQSMVSLTSGLMVSLITNIATWFMLPGNGASSLTIPMTLDNKTTLKPCWAYSATCSKTFGSFVIYSGAPKTNQPILSNSTAENFLALEKLIWLMILSCSLS